MTYNVPDASIFKAYDIRGIVGQTLSGDDTRAIGHAIGSEAAELGVTNIAVGYDGRLSGPMISSALIEGITLAGVNVIAIGSVPTPVAYYAAFSLGCNSAISVTGSHNPRDYNGFKIVLNGDVVYGARLQGLRQRIIDNRFSHGQGKISHTEIVNDYLNRICDDVKLKRPLKIIIDCGNGIAGAVAPQLFRQLGCQVSELFSEVDGNFPNHHPDPCKPENLVDLINALANSDADIGLAFDGDGDRLNVVTRDGEIIYPDRQLLLYAADVLSRNPGAQIIYDVKCTRNLASWIHQRGGQPLLWNTGHALIKAKLKETGALLAGEMSGHVFFVERWYGFDDGMYTAARLLEILSAENNINACLKALPDSINTPEINIKLAEGEPFEIIRQLKEAMNFPAAIEIIDIDGIRAEYPEGFGLVRASNTTPVLVLRFEADTATALASIQLEFREALKAVKSDIVCGF